MTVSPESLLEGLDDEQRIAAEALLGPVCILAGAGTGKTRAITHRIAYGVATGAYPPNRVMALTFTARAASELRSRLRSLGVAAVAARTFHAAALSQLNFFWPHVVGGQLPAVLPAKGRLLAMAAESARIRADTATLRDVAAEIEWRKISGMSIRDYLEESGRGRIGALGPEQVAELQQRYEDLKDERRQFDFEDVLLACTGMIATEPSVAMHVREQYRFFVVDEYQDVSPIQQQLLDAWLGGRSDLCVVGDPSQTIYSFAGARSDYLLDFPRRYANASLVRLVQNYRSTRAIVETANRLIREQPGAVLLRARPSEDGESAAPAPAPRILSFHSDAEEARSVARSVAAEIEAGTAAEDIAILFRVNAQSALVEAALEDAGVPFRVRGSVRFFDQPVVRRAVLALRGASVSISGEPLFKSVSDVLRGLGWSAQAPEQRGARRDEWEALNAIVDLVDRAAAGTTFREFSDELLERQAAAHEPDVRAVTLATIHSAKGLEWPSVYLMGLSEGLLPISYAATPEQVAEERRLLYVGLTRAQRRLQLSWSDGSDRSRGQAPSRFLAELGTRSPGGAGAAVG